MTKKKIMFCIQLSPVLSVAIYYQLEVIYRCSVFALAEHFRSCMEMILFNQHCLTRLCARYTSLLVLLSVGGLRCLSICGLR